MSAREFTSKKLPNFKLLHQREKARLEKFKESNSRNVTRPQPFRLRTNNFLGVADHGGHPDDGSSAADGGTTTRAPVPPSSRRPNTARTASRAPATEATTALSARGITPRTARMYKQVHDPNSAVVAKPPTSSRPSHLRASSPAHVRTSSAPSSDQSGAATVAITRPPQTARPAISSHTGSQNAAWDARRPASARAQQAASAAASSAYGRSGSGSGSGGASVNVDAITRRYQQSVAAWSAKRTEIPSRGGRSGGQSSSSRHGQRSSSPRQHHHQQRASSHRHHPTRSSHERQYPPAHPTAAQTARPTTSGAAPTETAHRRPPSAPSATRPAGPAPPAAVAPVARPPPGHHSNPMRRYTRPSSAAELVPEQDAGATRGTAEYAYKPQNVPLHANTRASKEAYKAALAHGKREADEANTQNLLLKLMNCSKDPINVTSLDFYGISKVLGEGAFGKVKLATHKLSQQKVAMKIFEKFKIRDEASRKRVIREIRNMQRMRHPSLIRLFEVVDSPKRMCLVLEYADGGDLCKYVRAKRRLPEDEARKLFAQIACGIQYCHANLVVHRDIKLENCLLDSRHNCKIVDFGFSTIFRHGQKLRTFCGSPSYAAPEIIARKPYNGPPVDVWSLGVLLFGMLAGHFPFQGDTPNDLYRHVLRGEYKCPSYISREAQHLLRRMLCVDPQRRYTMTDCLSHSWTEMSFKPQRQNFGGGFPSSDLYMKRLVSWIRHNDNDTRRPGQQDHWWWHMADVQPVPPGSQAGSTLVPTDARTATADHRLYQMLGSHGTDHGNDPSLDMIGMAPVSGDCDAELLLEMESWGMSHDFVMRSFATFPYNHASASYAILEHVDATQREDFQDHEHARAMLQGAGSALNNVAEYH